MAFSGHRVLFPIFPDFNTLDLNGPIEVVGSSAIAQKKLFSTTVASATETTRAFENVSVKRDVSFADLLRKNENGDSKLSEYDVMIIPGGPGVYVEAAIDSSDGGLLDVIQAFAELPNSEARTRWLVSICTGAGFLAVRGLLAGRIVTAHWSYLDRLRELCAESVQKHGGSETNVVRKRWVDAGRLPSGTRLLTAGGVSCGIDCTLWMVSELVGMEAANSIAMGMDYDWKYSNIPVTEGQIVASTKD